MGMAASNGTSGNIIKVVNPSNREWYAIQTLNYRQISLSVAVMTVERYYCTVFYGSIHLMAVRNSL